MSKKEKTKKDIQMAFDFARYLIDHPDELTKIPDGSEIFFNEKSEDGHALLPYNGKPTIAHPLITNQPAKVNPLAKARQINSNVLSAR
jgi:hypothetical protein